MIHLFDIYPMFFVYQYSIDFKLKCCKRSVEKDYQINKVHYKIVLHIARCSTRSHELSDKSYSGVKIS